MKFKIAALLAGEVPNDNDFVRVVNEIPEIIDSHNAHLAQFPRKTATAVELKLAYQIRAAAKNYQWGMQQATYQPGERFSKYGYRRKDNESEGDGRESVGEHDDDEGDSQERRREEEQAQAAIAG